MLYVLLYLLAGAHPREPLLDLLSITQAHTTSLEDHGRQLTKTLGQVSQAIFSASAKAAGGGGAAVRKIMAASSATAQAPPTGTTTTLETSLDSASELGGVQRRMADLSTTPTSTSKRSQQ